MIEIRPHANGRWSAGLGGRLLAWELSADAALEVAWTYAGPHLPALIYMRRP